MFILINCDTQSCFWFYLVCWLLRVSVCHKIQNANKLPNIILIFLYSCRFWWNFHKHYLTIKRKSIAVFNYLMFYIILLAKVTLEGQEIHFAWLPHPFPHDPWTSS